METERLHMLIKRLVMGTKTGRFRWEETAEDDLFRLTLDTGLIHIQQLGPGHTSYYRLTLLNQNNTKVEEVGAQSPTDNELLHDLYEAARKSALKPSDFLNELEQEVIRRSG